MEFHKACREMRREEGSLLNRLKSIKLDREWVLWVLNTYCRDEDGVKFPVLCNLRCGEWYVAPGERDGCCHFKSTDGHYGTWDFSLSRLNLNVVRAVESQSCVVILDATRKGKLFPDSFNRTIPIWCAVLNRIKGHVPRTQPLSVSESKNFTPSERDQVSKLLFGYVEKAVASGVDWDSVQLTKPLECVFLSRRTDFLKPSSRPSLEKNSILLLSVSDPDTDGGQDRLSWTYVQGAGDDHESWAKGLSPKEYYEKFEEIHEEGNGPIEVLEIVEKIVEGKRSGGARCAVVGEVVGEVAVGDVKLVVGKNHLETPDVIFVEKEEDVPGYCKGRIITDGVLKHLLADCPTPIAAVVRPSSKKDLQKALPILFTHLPPSPTTLTISCPTGTSTSVAFTVALVVGFSPNGWELDKDFASNPYPATPPTKDSIRKVLARVNTYLPGACPTRNEMKQVNRFFMPSG